MSVAMGIYSLMLLAAFGFGYAAHGFINEISGKEPDYKSDLLKKERAGSEPAQSKHQKVG